MHTLRSQFQRHKHGQSLKKSCGGRGTLQVLLQTSLYNFNEVVNLQDLGTAKFMATSLKFPWLQNCAYMIYKCINKKRITCFQYRSQENSKWHNVRKNSCKDVLIFFHLSISPTNLSSNHFQIEHKALVGFVVCNRNGAPQL